MCEVVQSREVSRSGEANTTVRQPSSGMDLVVSTFSSKVANPGIVSHRLMCLCWFTGSRPRCDPMCGQRGNPATSVRLIPRVMCWRLGVWHHQGITASLFTQSRVARLDRCNVDANRNVSTILSAVIFCLGGRAGVSVGMSLKLV